MQNSIQNLVIDKPKVVFFVCIAFFCIAIGGIAQLKNDPNPEILPQTHESRLTHEKLKQDYTGNKDLVVIMLKNDKNIFNKDTLERIPQLTQNFAKINVITQSDLAFIETLLEITPTKKDSLEQLLLKPNADDVHSILFEVKQQLENEGKWTDKLELQLTRYFDHLNPIIRIHSLYDTDNIFSQDDEIIVKPIYTEIPKTNAEMRKLELEVRSNELFDHLLVSEDAKSTGIYLELSLAVEDAEATLLMLDKVKQIITDNPGKDKVYVAGMPVTTSTISQVIDADMGQLFPIVLLLVLVILWLTFRDYKGLLLPILVVVFSLVSTLGLMSYANIPVNVITASLPVFLISIGIADGVHFYAEYRAQFTLYGDRKTALRKTLALLTKPIILTSITTALAFWSLASTEITQIALFGIFVGIGTLLAMLYALFLLPSLIMLLPQKPGTERADTINPNGFTHKVASFATHAIKFHSKKIISIFALISAVGIFGATNSKFDNNRVLFFSPQSDLVIAVENIKASLAGSEVLNINIKAPQENAMKSVENLQLIDELEKYAQDLEYVGTSLSLAKLVRRMNYVMHNNQIEYNVIPKIDAEKNTNEYQEKSKHLSSLISQYIFLYENGGGDLLSDVVTNDYSESNIKLYLRTNSSTAIEEIRQQIESYVSAKYPEELEVSFAGNGNLLVAAGEEIILGQMNSLLICFILVAILLTVQFKSIALGLVGFVPLALAVIVNFGILGYLGINIDIGTAIVSSIAIGIGVDYSIHYICRFKILLQSGVNREDAITGAVLSAGKAISYNAITVGIAFLALLLSGFVPIQTIGWLVSMSLGTSCIATLVIVPALLRSKTNTASKLINPLQTTKV